MSTGKIAALLLVVLVLNLSAGACSWFTSQGSQEQLRPAENQSPAEEDEEEPALGNPEKEMEKTGTEAKEETQK